MNIPKISKYLAFEMGTDPKWIEKLLNEYEEK